MHAVDMPSTSYRRAMLSLREVSKTYPGGQLAVDRLSLELAAGETVVLLGASGCGKTTTLKMINRLVEATSGEILVDGRATKGMDPVLLRRGIGYVFQGIGLDDRAAPGGGGNLQQEMVAV